MCGWIDPDFADVIVGLLGRTTTLTPIDALDRFLADELKTAFGDEVTFNAVRTARADVSIYVIGGKRHLVWDKEFFRRMVLAISLLEVDDKADRESASLALAYDLGSLLTFQAGHLFTSFNLAFRHHLFPQTFDLENSRRILQMPMIRDGSSQAWRLTNVGRMFCFLHEEAHCEAARGSVYFADLPALADSLCTYAVDLANKMVSRTPVLKGDMIGNLALMYLSLYRGNAPLAFADLERALLDKEEIACDMYAIRELVRMHPHATPSDFADIFSGVIYLWQIRDYVETLRLVFLGLATREIPKDPDFVHGGARNYLRGLFLLFELQRETADTLDQNLCEDALWERLRLYADLIENHMLTMDSMTAQFQDFERAWRMRPDAHENVKFSDRKKLTGLLAELFCLNDDPQSEEGKKFRQSVETQSLASLHDRTVELSTGFLPVMPLVEKEAFNSAIELLRGTAFEFDPDTEIALEKFEAFVESFVGRKGKTRASDL